MRVVNLSYYLSKMFIADQSNIFPHTLSLLIHSIVGNIIAVSYKRLRNMRKYSSCVVRCLPSESKISVFDAVSKIKLKLVEILI